MTRALYVIGGAGVGKSTFLGRIMRGYEFGPLQDLHSKKNAKAVVTLRGHEISNKYVEGLYLGVQREEFPGSDGLDRASSPTGKEWLETFDLPEVIVAEGATLATRPFLYALQETTDLRVVVLTCDPMVHDLRLLERGSGQLESFVQATITKTENLATDLGAQGVQLIQVDTGDQASWFQGLTDSINFLEDR